MQRYMGKLIDAKDLEKTLEGLTCCRWCKIGVKPPRRTLCSPECEHELKLRVSGNYLRYCVYQRDKGVCAECKIDTKKTAKQVLQLEGVERENFLKEHKISLKRKIFVKKFGGSLWDADHILEVKNGGGLCGIDNVQTLCIACHKNKTFKKIIV